MKFENNMVGSNLMLAITNGLYSRSLSCIREYVQNAYDQPSSAKRIDINLENGLNWIINDDGSGMNESELKIALGVGIYTKNYGKAEGIFGIGIWSGIAVCNKLVIITKKAQSREKLRIEVNARGIREDSIKNIPIIDFLTNNTGEIEIIEASEHDYDKSYTIIRLEDITPGGLNIFTENEMIHYVSENLPVEVDPEFKFANEIRKDFNGKNYRTLEIYVNGNSIYRLDGVKEELRNYYTIDFKVKDRTIAKCWYSLNKSGVALKGDRGITIRHNGFVVMDWGKLRSLIKGRFNDRFIGEIHVENTEPMLRPIAPRNDFQQNEVSDELYEQVLKFLIDMQRVNSFATVNIYSPLKKMDDAEKSDKSIADRAKTVNEIQDKNFTEDPSFLNKEKSYSKLKEDLENDSKAAKEKFDEFKEKVENEKKTSDPTTPEIKKIISGLTENKDLQKNIETLMTGKHSNDFNIDPFNPLKEKIGKKVDKNFNTFSNACEEIGKTLTLFKGIDNKERINEDEHVKNLFIAAYNLFRNIPEHKAKTEKTKWFDSAKNKDKIKRGVMCLLTLIDNMIDQLESIEIQ